MKYTHLYTPTHIQLQYSILGQTMPLTCRAETCHWVPANIFASTLAWGMQMRISWRNVVGKQGSTGEMCNFNQVSATPCVSMPPERTTQIASVSSNIIQYHPISPRLIHSMWIPGRRQKSSSWNINWTRSSPNDSRSYLLKPKGGTSSAGFAGGWMWHREVPSLVVSIHMIKSHIDSI